MGYRDSFALWNSRGIFLEPTMPGAVLGELTADISEKIGYSATVVLPATHDTGSRLPGRTRQGRQCRLYSSGTWSLLGVENQHAITNELARKQKPLPTRAAISSVTVSSRTSWAYG